MNELILPVLREMAACSKCEACARNAKIIADMIEGGTINEERKPHQEPICETEHCEERAKPDSIYCQACDQHPLHKDSPSV